MTADVAVSGSKAVAAAARGLLVPVIVGDAGEHAARRFLEFFAATIRNRNTRLAYYRAVTRFLAWCEHHEIGQLADIEPLHVAAYIETLGHDYEKPSVKQHLAAIRMLFDWLVTGGVLATNPAHAVRGPKHVVKRGKTPVLTVDQARALLDSIPLTRSLALPDGTTVEAPCMVGLRDRALIAVMT
ncbi:MAG: tyrosine-type recombinase/integrase, partial [Acetobacteraceae bacterium]